VPTLLLMLAFCASALPCHNQLTQPLYRPATAMATLLQSSDFTARLRLAVNDAVLAVSR
jgi:hypothetical protein